MRSNWISVVAVWTIIFSMGMTGLVIGAAPAQGGNPVVTIETDKGNIIFEMVPDVAPKTVARITELIQQGFYNGLNFHRVEPGFVIQGGDPNGNGTGGSGVKLPAEFNKKLHLLGTVAMARAQDPDSADSQFYICLAPQ